MTDILENALSFKYAEEEIYVSYNFVNLIPLGEAITGATWTCTVLTGTDASASSMLSGTADLSEDPIVTQKVVAGVRGATYNLKCVVTTANRKRAHSEVLVVR
jgi:hypothetical protein